MKNNRKKGFTIVELIIVIAVIAILASILIPTFSGLITKANITADSFLVKELNNALSIDSVEHGQHQTIYDALRATDEYGFNVSRINAKTRNNEILWDSVNDVFCYFDGTEIKYIPEAPKVKDVEEYQYFIIRDVKTQNDISTKYSTYLRSCSIDTITTTKGIDVGDCEGISTINYERTAANASDVQNVIIRTNGGTLIINAANDTVKHYGTANITNLTAVSNSSYYENGSVNQVNIKKGRLVLTNTENASVETIYLEKTNDSYDGIILATQSGAELPNLIARDSVSNPTEGQKLVVTIQTNVNNEGKQPQKTEKIYLYPERDVKEEVNGYNVSELGTLVVEAISSEAQTQAAEQISNPEVVAKVTEQKSAVEVANEEELTAALNAKAKFIKLIGNFEITSPIGFDYDVIIDGENTNEGEENYTISSASNRSGNRMFDMLSSNISVVLSNLNIDGVSYSKTERGINLGYEVEKVSLSLNNVVVKNAKYALNVPSMNNNLKIDINDCQLSGWAALNCWSDNYSIVVKNSTLIGINTYTGNSNHFTTVCLESDTTGKTNLYSSRVQIRLINCKIVAKSTNGNYQTCFGFWTGAVANTIEVNNCEFVKEGDHTYDLWVNNAANTFILDGEEVKGLVSGNIYNLK